MPRRLGVFCDVSNLYFTIRKKYQNRKLDYKKYIAFLKELGDISFMYAYVSQGKDETGSFAKALISQGFVPKYKEAIGWDNGSGRRSKADHDVTITMDIVKNINNLDMIILGTSDSDLLPVIQWVKEQDKKIITYACNIPEILRQTSSQWFEVSEGTLV